MLTSVVRRILGQARYLGRRRRLQRVPAEIADEGERELETRFKRYVLDLTEVLYQAE